MSYFIFKKVVVVFHFQKLMLSSNFKKIEVAFHFQTSAVAQHRLRPNKLNWTHNYKNKFTFLRFLYSLPHPIIISRPCYVCCRLCCNAQCRTQITVWGCFHFLLQCDIPISGFGSFYMGTFKGAVFKEF